MKKLLRSTGFLTLFLATLSFSANAQQQQTIIDIGAESKGLVGSKDRGLPFWLYSNTFGEVDPSSSNFQNNLYLHYRSTNADSSLRYAGGATLTARFASDDALFFPKIYGELGYKFLNLKIGRFFDPFEGYDTDLSMGSMLMSRNATPVPRILLETNGFTDVPLTQGYFQFKAMFAHGWLEKNRYVENPYLHQKYFYLKLNYKIFEGYGGIIHNVVWGGKNHPQYGDLPASFSDYLRVISGLGADAKSGAPGGEVSNVIGNSIAAYDFGFHLHLTGFTLSASRLFFLEDKVSTRFRSPWDGMWTAGINLKKNRGWITGLLWQHINTKRQDSFDWEPRGTASYYNHFIYKDGWSYANRVIGNPLFLFGPNANFVSNRAISNDIIIAHHIGFKGQPDARFKYKVFLTYSRNYGTAADQTTAPSGTYVPLNDIRKDEYSTLLDTEYTLPSKYNIRLVTALAYDWGELYGKNRLGLSIGLRWDGSVRR